MSVTIERLVADDWRKFRAVRLRALLEAPGAFGSTFQSEQGREDAEWRRLLAERDQFGAFQNDDVVGPIGLLPPHHKPGVAHIISMWVDPALRGQGVGDALVQAAIAAALNHGWHEIELWVSDGNSHAEQLYSRHGFRATDLVQEVVPGQPDRLEFLMALTTPESHSGSRD